MAIIIFIIVLWYSGLFFQTFFLHRYAAHQTYTMSKFGEKLCFILTWITQGSNYLSAYGYGVMHRMHHAFADTEKDPHSPKYDPNPLAMMWRTKNVYQQINKQKSRCFINIGLVRFHRFKVFDFDVGKFAIYFTT